ncbi:MAG TPA: signal recognition particle-docking protein FtsY [Solirubrobacteraceae bacterium]|nr:signal recognition particle-docking protein FtsY [Solirubrobacteraceae bacterium]
MARDWNDLLITDGPRAPEPEPEDKRRGVFARLRDSMARTRRALGSEVRASLAGELDDAAWERLEEALIAADVGAPTTARVVQELEAQDDAEPAARVDQLVGLLAGAARVGDEHIDVRAQPTVVLVVGVNGTGKTTTAGKLAYKLHREFGLQVMLVAADTFRAAAREQLEGWGERAGVPVVGGAAGADPGAVAFDALARAADEKVDVVIVDTAGRVHTRSDLMAELTKIRDVISRQRPDAPHETLLTIDATTGQNGLRQAREFAAAAGVTGIVLTKLDGTARGGIALAIADELKIPVKLIGIGESVEDLRPFDAEDFAKALILDG